MTERPKQDQIELDRVYLTTKDIENLLGDRQVNILKRRVVGSRIIRDTYVDWGAEIAPEMREYGHMLAAIMDKQSGKRAPFEELVGLLVTSNPGKYLVKPEEAVILALDVTDCFDIYTRG